MASVAGSSTCVEFLGCQHPAGILLSVLIPMVPLWLFLGLGYDKEAAAPPEGFHHEEVRSLAGRVLSLRSRFNSLLIVVPL